MPSAFASLLAQERDTPSWRREVAILTPARATWRDVLVFRDYGITELRTSLVRCVDHRDRALLEALCT